MAEHNELGRLGEELAADYLKGAGFRILDRNWRFHHNEIDLTGIEGDQLVVVEIKARTENPFQEPEFSVTPDKQRAMVRAGNAYVRVKRISLEVRFDIVTVVFSGELHRINHIRDAFYPV